MERPMSQAVDSILEILGIRAPRKSHRKIINALIRLLYFAESKEQEFQSCPLSIEEISVLMAYYYYPGKVTEILSVSERSLRTRMARIRTKLSAKNNIEAICIARESGWIGREEMKNDVKKNSL